jgi:OOP family OmpA-OmpF porin
MEGAARAAEPGSHYVGVLGSYVNVDSTREADDGVGGHLLYGWRSADGWGVEGQVAGAIFETGNDDATDFYRMALGGDVTYTFRRDASFSPFVLAGVGIANNDVGGTGDDGTGLFANVGVGVLGKAFGETGVRLRGEARYVHDDYSGGVQDWWFNLGATFPIGQPRVVEKRVVVETFVDRPMPAPSDADGDGVPDAADNCTDTLAGIEVDRYGCALKAQAIELQGVTFEFDSALLTQSSRFALDQVVAALKGQPSMLVEIAGHTDTLGPADYNMKLSRGRAESVRDYLVFRGIEAERMTAVGYGETQPVTDDSDGQGSELNRRTEFRVLKR